MAPPDTRGWRHEDLLLLEAWWCLDSQPTIEDLRTTFKDESEVNIQRFLMTCDAALKGHVRRRLPDQKYRLRFADFYRQTLLAKRYHEPVLRTAVLWKGSIRVNGEDLPHSEAVRGAATAVAAELCAMTRHLEAATCGGGAPCADSAQGLRQVLLAFDAAYRRYERLYIGEVIEFEQRADRLLRAAVLAVEQLDRCDQCHVCAGRRVSSARAQCCLLEAAGVGQRYLGELCAILGELNNRARSGRKDFTTRALQAAQMLPEHSPLQPIAWKLRKALQSVCDWLRGHRGTKLEPILSQNSELVELLDLLEEAWQSAETFLCDEEMVIGLERFIRFLREDAIVACPWLPGSFSERSPEACLALPRMLLLFATGVPEGAGGRDRFPVPLGGCPELTGLAESARASLGVLCTSGMSHAEALADLLRVTALGEILVCSGRGQTLTMPHSAQRQLREFHVDLESMSLALQRSVPSCWNNFLGILLLCALPHEHAGGIPAP